MATLEVTDHEMAVLAVTLLWASRSGIDTALNDDAYRTFADIFEKVGEAL